MCLRQKCVIYPKIHILKFPIFTKFSFLKSSIFTKFIFLKSHFSQNSQFWNLIYITNEICLCVCLSPLVSPKPFDLGWWNFICAIYTWYGRILRKKISEKSKKNSKFFPDFFSSPKAEPDGDRREPKGEFFTKFIFLKSHFSQNSHFRTIKIKGISGWKVDFLPQCDFSNFFIVLLLSIADDKLCYFPLASLE